VFINEEYRSQEPGGASAMDGFPGIKHLAFRMKLLLKTSFLVDEIEVETFLKTPSLYGWCILTSEF
jgi:hypothetical protein